MASIRVGGWWRPPVSLLAPGRVRLFRLHPITSGRRGKSAGYKSTCAGDWPKGVAGQAVRSVASGCWLRTKMGSAVPSQVGKVGPRLALCLAHKRRSGPERGCRVLLLASAPPQDPLGVRARSRAEALFRSLCGSVRIQSLPALLGF